MTELVDMNRKGLELGRVITRELVGGSLRMSEILRGVGRVFLHFS